MSKLPTTIACGLLIAIFFVVIQSPSKQTVTAQQKIEQLGKAITAFEQDESRMTLDSLHALTLSIRKLNELIANQGKELQSIEQCQQADAEEFRAKLVALESKETASQTSEDCECNCAAELESLKARVAALEARCPPATATYPSASSVKSAGSTGTVVATSGGSTGSAVKNVSPPVNYGSTGTTPLQTKQRTLTVYTRDNCSCCKKWMETEYQKVSKAGVQVAFVEDLTGTVPRFDVCDEDGKCRSYTGFTSAETLLAKTVAMGPVKAAIKGVMLPVTRANHWSYPGDLRQHLEQEHLESTAGLSRQQMLDLHDSLHESESPQLAINDARPPLLSRQTRWYLGKNLGRR